MVALSVEFTPTPSFEAAQMEAGEGYMNKALLAELNSSWFFVGDPRLTDLPDFFGPFFAAIAVAAVRTPDRTIRVLDFGGGIGRYKAYVDAMFGGAIKMEWVVIETALYVEHGRANPAPGVAFETSLGSVSGEFDFAFFSGVLQYIPDWQGVLCHPVIATARHIFITRTVIGEEEKPYIQTVTYQSGTVKLSARIIARADLEGAMRPTHQLFASYSLQQHLGQLGANDAPSMLWRKSQ